jgi:hypothetical protein
MYAMMFHETTGVKLELAEIWMGCDNNSNPIGIPFEVILANFRETVIDELAAYWEAQGDPLDVAECKRFFL